MAVSLMFILAVTNPNNKSLEGPKDLVHQLQIFMIPAMCTLCLAGAGMSTMIKKEEHHQKLCCLAGLLIMMVVGVNELVWRMTYNPAVNGLLVDLKASNPIALFYLTEIGWCYTIVLVFFTVMIRPRFPYLMLLTGGSFIMYLTAAYFLRHGLAMQSILLRSVVYCFCCFSNIVAGWNLEQSERKTWFLSKGLEQELEAEKQSLREKAEQESQAELLLIGYLCKETCKKLVHLLRLILWMACFRFVFTICINVAFGWLNVFC
jgi:hypothetical protein